MSLDTLIWALNTEVHPAACKLTLIVLAASSNGSSESSMSLRDLVKKTSLDRKTVIECLDTLEESGFLTDTGMREGATGRIKVYRFNGETQPRQLPVIKSGMLYMIVTSIGCKIGITKSTKSRIQAHLSSLPISPESVYTCQVDDMRKHEYELHRRFSNKRIKGEWFELDNDDVATIVGKYGMRLYGEEA